VDGDDLFWIELFFDECAAFGGDEEPVGDEGDVDLFLREVEGGEVFGGHVGVADVEEFLSADLDDVAEVLDIFEPLALSGGDLRT
jgi:hypothetical protein